jgi:hypothetical protein
VPSRCAIVLAPFEFAVKHPEIKMPAFDRNDPAFAPFLENLKPSKITNEPENKSLEQINKEIEVLADYGKI